MTKEEYILKELMDPKNDELSIKDLRELADSFEDLEKTKKELNDFGFCFFTGFDGIWQFKGDTNLAEYDSKERKLAILPGYSMSRLVEYSDCPPKDIIGYCKKHFLIPEEKPVTLTEPEYKYLKACETSLCAFQCPTYLCPRCGKAVLVKGYVCPCCGFDDSANEDNESE